MFAYCNCYNIYIDEIVKLIWVNITVATTKKNRDKKVITTIYFLKKKKTSNIKFT